MLNSTDLSQRAFSGRDTNQAGRDITNNIINIEMADIELFPFYEEDIKNTIVFFNDNLKSFSDDPFPDNKAITIQHKNTINNLSYGCFKTIEETYLPKFGKIRSFLENPKNQQYLNMYSSTVTELKAITLAIQSSLVPFDIVFAYLYGRIINPYKNNKNFMQIRANVYLFLYFMYYNCDIGIKDDSELNRGEIK